MAHDLVVARQLAVCGQIVELADEPGDGHKSVCRAHSFVLSGLPGHQAVDVTQYVTALPVNAEMSRRTGPPALFEEAQQPSAELRVRRRQTSDGVADPYDGVDEPARHGMLAAVTGHR